jgi:hypothetical protein
VRRAFTLIAKSKNSNADILPCKDPDRADAVFDMYRIIASRTAARPRIMIARAHKEHDTRRHDQVDTAFGNDWVVARTGARINVHQRK